MGNNFSYYLVLILISLYSCSPKEENNYCASFKDTEVETLSFILDDTVELSFSNMYGKFNEIENAFPSQRHDNLKLLIDSLNYCLLIRISKIENNSISEIIEIEKRKLRYAKNAEYFGSTDIEKINNNQFYFFNGYNKDEVDSIRNIQILSRLDESRYFWMQLSRNNDNYLDSIDILKVKCMLKTLKIKNR